MWWKCFLGEKEDLQPASACPIPTCSHANFTSYIKKTQFVLTTEPSCHYWTQNLRAATMCPAELAMAQLPLMSKMNWLILLPSIHPSMAASGIHSWLFPGAQLAGCTLEPLKGVLLPLSQCFLAAWCHVFTATMYQSKISLLKKQHWLFLSYQSVISRW